jgi:hypothetical protein
MVATVSGDPRMIAAEKALVQTHLDRLTSLIQVCCDGSSEDDPAELCARRVQSLIDERDAALARAEAAERLCMDLADDMPPDDWRRRVESMRERLGR